MSERVVRLFAPDVYHANGTIQTPQCCGQPMEGDGECIDGCCDDWECGVCGRRERTEAPD